jgi:hypothetical protein
MNISLDPRAQQLLDRLMAEGGFTRIEDALHYALHAANEFEGTLDRDYIRQALAEAEEQAARGEHTTLRDEKELRAFFEDIARRGQERLANASKKAS